MSTTQSVNDLLNGSSGPPAFKFEKIGDTAKGTITALDTQHVRDFKTQEPRFYSDGNPIMQIVITLRHDDNEESRLFCKVAMRDAIREAVEKAGAKSLEIGGRLAVQYSEDEPPDNSGLNPRKLFQAQYKAPENTISANDLL